MDRPDRLSPHSVDSTLTPSLEGLPTSRRCFLLAGIGVLLTGCASAKMTTALPGPVWTPRSMPEPEIIAPPKTVPQPDAPPNLLARNKWATSQPVPMLMDRMLPVQWITIHHDGMEPFFAHDQSSAAGRLEAIRRAHRNKGWGDIGYHYAIDREGRLWEGRPMNWQGAHVKDCNEGNIGVVTLGNFDRQTPTPPQLATLNRHVNWLMKRYKVQAGKVRTHQEWPSARTACPGTNLQRYVLAARKSRQIA